MPRPTQYPIDKIVNAVLSYKNLNKMSNFATSTSGTDVRVFANPDDKCFSYEEWWTGKTIQLGRKFYQTAFNDTEDVLVANLKDKYKEIASVMFGVYYHELFHVLFTPFALCSEYLRGCEYAFQNFAHQVSNILEDITIEGTGCHRYPFALPYIEKLSSVFKQPEQLEMVKDAITTDENNPSTMLAYLLHFCRDTDLSTLPSYKLWNDNKEFIEWGAYKCINTINATLRCKRQIAYALQLCKILDMKAPDKDSVEHPNLSNLGNESRGLAGGCTNGISGSGADAIKPLQNLTDTSSKGLKGTSPDDTDDDAKVPEELKEKQATREDNSSSSECPLNSDLTKDGITMLANDDPVSRYSHYPEKLNKYLSTKEYLPEYNKIVKRNDKQIRNVVAIIRKMYATNNASWSHYKMRGKLDSSTFYKKDNYKIFKKKNAPSPTADLVFEILVDNSGSMSGKKARLAGEALIIFCEALHRLHIPFSVDAFTEGGRAAITVNLKEYEENYDKVKTNMTLFTEELHSSSLHTWSGNIDEINLRYVSDELALRKEKDKVLIVISDGATCGDWHALKHVAETIEAVGTTVLGIGIFDSNVEKIYSKHIVLRTKEDLEKLGSFLNTYLIGKIFK